MARTPGTLPSDPAAQRAGRIPVQGRGRDRMAAAYRSPAGIPLLLLAGALVLSFLQLPGQTVTDSRIELSVDPTLFFTRSLSVWLNTRDLGHVQSGQFVGYVFPMGPWFVLAKAIGLPMWIAQRLWMGALIGLAGWGTVRLVDELYSPRRGVAHLVAGVVFAANPYVIVFGSRATVSLLAYVCLPWLLVATHRGLAEASRWRWPAVYGLVLACAGGGVNAALLPWVLLPSAALALYEVALASRALRAAWSFAWRAALCTAVGAAWWLVPVLLQARYGSDFLAFLEQPRSVWATTSMSESLRLLGYWIVYVGAGFRGYPQPYVSVAPTYLFDLAVVTATLLVPAAAVWGLRSWRGWRYGPFFGLIAVLSLVVMSAGFPEGKPLEDALSWAYYHVSSLQFLRTTYKAAPGLALALALLGGAGAAALVRWASAAGSRPGGPRISRWALAVLVAVPVLYALPLFTGRALDARLAYEVPGYWRTALADAGRTTPPNFRVMVLPGQLFGWYRWGETVDTIAPALTRRPVLTRTVVRYSDPRSAQLQAAVDDTIQQARLVPSQLEPLLRLMGVGQLLVAADGRTDQSGESGPAEIAGTLNVGYTQRRRAQAYGRLRPYIPEAGRGGVGVLVPDLARYPLRDPGPGIVRVHARGRATVLDGDADGVVSLAGAGRLDPQRALFYAGDLGRAAVRSQVRRGATLVFTDSNRRRYLLGTRMNSDAGPTLGPRDRLQDGLPAYDLFPRRGAAAQTVASYTGLRALWSPAATAFALFPEHRASAALDGDLRTSWIAASQAPRDRFLFLELRRPRTVSAIRVWPHADALGATERIAVSANGGPERVVRLRRGWNTVPVDGRPLRTLKIRVAAVTAQPFAGRGGLDELQIPGLTVRERLRLPTDLAAAAAGLSLSRNPVDVILERQTADFPFYAGGEAGSAQAENPLDRVDPEPALDRIVTLPARRTFQVGGWATVDPAAPDLALDTLAGVPAGWRYASSSRFEGRPRNRASSAFDRRPATAWVADRVAGGPDPWLQVRAPAPFAVRRFRLVPGGAQYAFPSLVRVEIGGRRFAVPVGADGRVALPRSVRGRTLRITVLNARLAQGAALARLLRAVAIREVAVPGLRPPRPRRQGAVITPCGSILVRAGAAGVRAQATSDLSVLDSGRPLAIRACGVGQTLTLPAGATEVRSPRGGLVRANLLRMTSPALLPLAAPSAAAAIRSPGESGTAWQRGVTLAPPGPSWLVLGESYSRGWGAWCRDRQGREHDLGAPVPIDGYANGWAIDSSCRGARFAFAPQRWATVSYIASGAGCLALLAVAGFGFLRRRRLRATTVAAGDVAPGGGDRGGRGADGGTNGAAASRVNGAGSNGGADAATAPGLPMSNWSAPPRDPIRRISVPWAVPVVVAAGGIGATVFAVRAGIGLAIMAGAFAYAGVSVRRLLAVALAGYLSLPVLYAASPSPNLGGFYFGYADHYIGAHWIAVGATCCLAAAAGLALLDLRHSRTFPPGHRGPGGPATPAVTDSERGA